MGKFTLINPAIMGDINITSNAETELKAAKEIWDNISKYTNNNVPVFYFTLRGGGIISHFSVKENSKSNNNEVNYLIEKIHPNLDNQKEIKYANKASNILKKLKTYQSGGKRSKKEKDEDEDDDDKGKRRKRYSKYDDSSSDDDLESYYTYLRLKNKSSPISYWWYTPSFYQDYNVVFTPTFKPIVVPYVQWQILY